MNPAPDQPPVSNTPSSSPMGVIPTPVTTATVSTPPASPPSPLTNNPPPTINTPPSVIPIDSNQISNPPTSSADGPPHKKFPFMMVTLFLAIALAGFVGSFLFLSNTSNNSQKTPAQIKITPPISVAPSIIPAKAATNPFATSSSDLANPFASPTASLVNPFGTYQNPFSSSENATANQTYQNPFEKLK